MIDSLRQVPIALIDLDGTLADYDYSLCRDMEMLRSPGEPEFTLIKRDEEEPHIKARMDLIRSNPAWWESLPELPVGMEVYKTLLTWKFRIVVLTQGPRINAEAWKGKLLWVRKHLELDTDVIITRDKSLVYGKILVDDFPPYIEGWLSHRPRGQVIMPAQPWNLHFKHPQVYRYDGSDHMMLDSVIAKVHANAIYDNSRGVE